MMTKKITLFILLMCFMLATKAFANEKLATLQKVYPEYIQKVTNNYIAWKDGTRIPVSGSIPFLSFFSHLFLHVDHTIGTVSQKDLEHDTYVPILRKMYGATPEAVKQHLVTVYWMPKVFGTKYPLRVTTINGVDKKLRRISAELEKLPPSYYKYLSNPAGSFYWRKVENMNYLSSHSFGIAIDINSHYSNYWLWDLRKAKDPEPKIVYRNKIPLKIVEIFEKEGFYWGGHWYFYDTMHFEYRPELFA